MRLVYAVPMLAFHVAGQITRGARQYGSGSLLRLEGRNSYCRIYVSGAGTGPGESSACMQDGEVK
jgi:hypothetical protein